MTTGACPVAVVVNDDLSQLLLMSKLLEKEELRVRPCRSAEEALTLMAEQGPPDVIVTDLYMPGIDGWRFCRLLRSPEYPAFNRIPILVVSWTFSGADAEQITANLGANAFLAAPYEPSELRASVRALLEGRRPRLSMRVLIVEDSPMQSTILSRAFAAHGYTVMAASTGEEGRSLFRDHSPQMAILDYHLPDVTSDQLLSEFKQAAVRTVAIMITANPSPDLALRFMRIGADGHVRKPFDPEYLIDLCEKVWRERSLLAVEDLLEERTRQLRERERQYAQLCENANDVIYTHDLSGRLTSLNRAAERIIGYTRSEAMTMPIAHIIAPEYLGLHHEMMEQNVRGETSGEAYELEVVTRAGGRVSLEVSSGPIYRDGEVVGVQGIARDVSERKRLEAQLSHAQKMEAIGTLAGGVAHDFNNLLTPILGYTSLLKLRGRPGGDVYQIAQVIEGAGERCAQLANRLLGFARGGKHLDVPVDTHNAVREVVELLSRTIDKRITITQRLLAEESVVLGDPNQIQQVLLNLAVNARDAMPDGGNLHFESAVAVLDEDYCRTHQGATPGRYIMLSVTDTGVGIPREIQQRVFEPFFTTKESGKGSGMGLAMVYGIVKNHDGTIRIYSEEGIGTSFKVYWPLATGVSPAPFPIEKAQPIPGRGRILLVDDEELVRATSAELLRQMGYDVVTVSDGQEAVEYYRRCGDRIDLVIIDLVMPRLGGGDCFRALKALNPSIRAVLSTGYGLNEVAQQLLDEGMAGFLQKPYQISELSEVIAQALQHRK
ncbi:MAG: hypothetical protein C3F12_12280 [Candidatus Methylomirabilota bacterium]|nr:MAG: hypothetical protein C3F12_12280 [candidate division NC10 bacterium]